MGLQGRFIPIGLTTETLLFGKLFWQSLLKSMGYPAGPLPFGPCSLFQHQDCHSRIRCMPSGSSVLGKAHSILHDKERPALHLIENSRYILANDTQRDEQKSEHHQYSEHHSTEPRHILDHDNGHYYLKQQECETECA